MFDVNKFERAKFVDREGTVSVPSLSEFFEDGAEPVVTVKGLNAEEIYSARQDAQKGRVMSEIIGKLSGGKDREKASAILEALGMNDDAPTELVQIYSHLEFGMVEPKLSRPQVIKFCRAFPIEAAQINQKILELSGKGAVAEAKP